MMNDHKREQRTRPGLEGAPPVRPARGAALRWAALALLCWACSAAPGEGEAADAAAEGGADGAAVDGAGDAAGAVRCDGDAPGLVRPTGWQVASHCPGVDPDYEGLFDDTVVHRLDLAWPAATEAAMQADLKAKLEGGGGGDDGPEPDWFEATLRHDGRVWAHVGIRYKGNSSLRSAYNSGVKKLSFRLNFDKFEDQHPEIDDQRFYGFKKMTFSNGFKDSSLIRDKLAADIFRAGGVPAARGAFVRVYVDAGDGPVYFGLYTMIEDPSNKLIKTQFKDGSGNLYKPEGTGATWGSFVEADFEKKTNEEEADFSDIKAAIAALHADRTTDPAAWRKGLEAVFNVTAFLRWLAINQAMRNWDTYGAMNHNYYVYGDPSDGGRLVWMPWDLNEAMLEKGGGGGGGKPPKGGGGGKPPKGGGGGGPGADNSAVLLESTTSEWPLIRFLLDDPVYMAAYEAELGAALTGCFAVEAVHKKMQAYHDLIAPYVTGAGGNDGEKAPHTFLSGASAFETSLSASDSGLKAHVTSRHAAVKAALGQ